MDTPSTSSRKPQIAGDEETTPLMVPSAPESSRPSAPLVAGAFAAGLFLGTRPGRHLTRGALRAALMLVKPALLVGGLLKWRELSRRPEPQAPPPES